MIVQCESGAIVVINECPPGAFLAVGNVRGAQGAIVDPVALDLTIAELQRIRAALKARSTTTV